MTGLKNCIWPAAGILVVILGCSAAKTVVNKWQVHDQSRPRPAVITPPARYGDAPSDAIILFDGTDLSKWVSQRNGTPAGWLVRDGCLEVTPGRGDIQTKESFGNCQLHIEWASPAQVKGSGQEDGNSGVYLMSRYEVQVLDSYGNTTYADGQAGAIYGQSPPLVNVCRPPGQWQSYDIIFHRPIFENGICVKPASITILQNGVLVQDNWQIEGMTLWKRRPYYEPHPDKLPLRLQEHDCPVRFRNIWIRPL